MEEVMGNGVDTAMDYAVENAMEKASIWGMIQEVDYADLGIKALAVVGVSYLAYKTFDFIKGKVGPAVKQDIKERTQQKVAQAKKMFSKAPALVVYADSAGNAISKEVFDYLKAAEAEKARKILEDNALPVRYDAAGYVVSEEVWNYIQEDKKAKKAMKKLAEEAEEEEGRRIWQKNKLQKKLEETAEEDKEAKVKAVKEPAKEPAKTTLKSTTSSIKKVENPANEAKG